MANSSNKTSKWPNERDVLFRPDRAKYIKSKSKIKECVFCYALKKGISYESLLLFVNDNAMAILNKYPYNAGHLLVLPKRHEGRLLKLSDEEFNSTNRLLRFSIEVLQKEYKPKAMNVGLNLGKYSGAGIPDHMHYHIVPRWRGDLNFFPLMSGTKVISEKLKDTYHRLLPYFKKYKER